MSNPTEGRFTDSPTIARAFGVPLEMVGHPDPQRINLDYLFKDMRLEGAKMDYGIHDETPPTGADLVYGDREEEYGDPSVSFERIAELWSTYLRAADENPDLSITAKDVAMMMVLLKVSRSVTDDKADTFDDIAGYAECAKRVLGLA